ncbi:MAG: UDP binding domain-containing protein, partial [Acetobacter orientalis]
GPGYGGSCFPKDTLALSRFAQEAQSASRLVETTVQVNEARKAGMAGRIAAACGGSVAGKTVGVLGLTFKPETDDMRESASIPILHRLAEAGAQIKAFDPVGMDAAKPLLPEGVEYCTDALSVADGADVLVVLTEWNIFRALAPEALVARMRHGVVVDLRNIFDPAAMRAAGLQYQSVGRP